MSKQGGPMWMSLTLVGALAAAGAQAQSEATVMTAGGGEMAIGHRAEITATVKSIDLATRRVELQGPEGRVLPITVGDDVKNLDKLAVGDKVLVEYFQSLAFSLVMAEAGLSLSESTDIVQPEGSGAPGKAMVHRVTAVARIIEIDVPGQVVTLVGPRGNEVDVEVPKDALAKVKVGDLVKVVYTEALAASIEKLPKP